MSNPIVENRRALFASDELGERVAANKLRFVRHYTASIERVWEAITTADGVAAWLGTPVGIRLVHGGPFRIAFSPQDRMDGHIIEIEPYRRLVLAWHEHSDGDEQLHASADDATSLVTFVLSPDTAERRCSLRINVLRATRSLS